MPPARLEYVSYDHYTDPECPKKIADTFPRKAVLANSLENYAEANRKKRGT